jgi:hypothetical protein
VKSSWFTEDSCRREDLADLLEDSRYYDAILNNLPRVKAVTLAQQELANANELIASELCILRDVHLG